MIDNTLLSVKGLEITISNNKKTLYPVRDVSFFIKRGESVCLVGESGCGKSVTALSLMRLLSAPPFIINKGKISFEGIDIIGLSTEKLSRIRGKKIAMIFQEPMTALNPVFTIGDQISEIIKTHLKLNKKQTRERIIELLKQVGMPAPGEMTTAYPHQLSGGMRQRAMIAMSLACQPKLLIADEPTTALDVTTQAQILELLHTLREKYDLGLLLITHNLGVVAQIAHRVLIMYAGKIVEDAPINDLFDNPLHPYTQGLLNSVPYHINADTRRLTSIPGNVPSLDAIPPGCSFQDRCPRAMDICRKIEPEEVYLDKHRRVACHLFR